MADVFISCSPQDRALAAALAERLESRGYSVWWQRDLFAGDNFQDVILQHLRQAGHAIVIWTPDSVKSRWVAAEANMAQQLGKLIGVRSGLISEADVPLGFRDVRTFGIDDVDAIIRAMHRVPATETTAPAPPAAASSRPATSAPKASAALPAWKLAELAAQRNASADELARTRRRAAGEERERPVAITRREAPQARPPERSRSSISRRLTIGAIGAVALCSTALSWLLMEDLTRTKRKLRDAEDLDSDLRKQLDEQRNETRRKLRDADERESDLRKKLEEQRNEIEKLKERRGAPPPPIVPGRREIVDCSVFAPPGAPPDSTILVQVFFHRPDEARRARALARMMDDTTDSKGGVRLNLPVDRGATIQVALSAPGLAIEEPEQAVEWNGDPAFAQFTVTFPATPRAFYCTARISINGGLAGRITFRLSSDSTHVRTTTCVDESAKRYSHAFLSYASADRAEVLKRAQALDAARMSFFQDVLSLRAGDQWESKIYQHIDKCDLFLLFWSRAAKDSEWVIKETEYALERRTWGDDPDIVPIILEDGPVVMPPDSLKSIHFNDAIHYLISAS